MIPFEVEGFISDEQGRILQDYACKMVPGIAVEIGSYRGKSASYIASAMPKGSHLYCVDPWQDSESVREKQYRTERNFSLFVENINACGLAEKITPVRDFSYNAAKEWGKPISFLYIDGGHDYDEVVRDIEGFVPHVIPGGVVLFDDYSPAFAGVQKAFDERFEKFCLHEVPSYDSKDKYGIRRWLAVGFP
jgi:MMP 1-O-methyltransferase